MFRNLAGTVLRCTYRNLPLTKTVHKTTVTFGSNYYKFRPIHTSRPNCSLLPIFLRPILQLAAALFGRTIRKWWQRLPPDERQRIWKRLRGKKTHITAGFTALTGLGVFFYVEHIEEVPITKRKRFILYNEKQMESIAEFEFNQQLNEFKSEVIPPSHHIYRRVVRVANRILEANKSLPEVVGKNWSVTVIDRPDLLNAFVLPHGKIVIFTGMLNIASNDDQLALVMSHEMAHAILQHMAENLSKVVYVEVLLVLPLVLIWSILPDFTALFSQWLSSKLADIIIHLPFSRSIEKEADVVGLAMAARACFDIREAPVFWGKMAEIDENNSEVIEWLSTHPAHETRQFELADLMPAALSVRADCSCPRLPSLSPAQMYYSRRPEKLAS